VPLTLAQELELVSGFLKTQTTLALSTTGDAGSPGVAPLFFLPGEHLDLYWFSSPRSAHGRNLKRDPAAAVAVYCHAEGWADIRGVQMQGAVGVITGPRRRAIANAYVERFRLGTLFRAAMVRSRLYVFRPRWVRYIDNSRGFGFKFEFELDL
jgi:uncharacterized protein YhbP (UPF0306 family)